MSISTPSKKLRSPDRSKQNTADLLCRFPIPSACTGSGVGGGRNCTKRNILVGCRVTDASKTRFGLRADSVAQFPLDAFVVIPEVEIKR